MIDQARILVADDNPILLDCFKDILLEEKIFHISNFNNSHLLTHGVKEIIKKPGAAFEVVCCDQGDKAVGIIQTALTEKRPFTIAFLDMRMPPGPNGLWTAKKIRELDPYVEIVMVSAYSDYGPEEITSLVPPAHKLFYLKKPFQIREIYYLTHVLCSKWAYEQKLLCLNKNLEDKVTQRTKALDASEKRFRLLVENVIFGILIVHNDRIVFMGPDQGEISTSVLRSFKTGHFAPDDAEKVQKFYRHILTTGKSKEGLEIRFFPNGKGTTENMRWVHCKGSVIEYRGAPAVMIAMVDVTKVKEMEKVLHLREKMATLGDVAAGIAHEIRNPLSGINILTEGIRENFEHPENSEDIKQLLNEIQKASDKIESTVRRILDFSRPSQPHMKKIEIDKPIKEAIELSKTTLRKSNITFESHLSDNLSSLYIDGLLIEQVILNLVNNAADAMKKNDGHKIIRINTWQTDNDLYVSVSDSGAGVPEKFKEKVFDPFFTTKPDGSGIGLSFCQQVIANHNGTIELLPSDLGGAEFRLKLPLDKRILSR